MDENKTNEGTESTVQDNANGDNSEATSVLDQTNAAIERLAREREAIKAENDRTENLLAIQKLSGVADRSSKPVVEPTSKEYADAVMSGKIKAQ